MRPNDISDEDIQRWNSIIENDKAHITDVVIKETYNRPEVIEVCLAGLWMAEQLSEMGVEDETIYEIQYQAGRLSVGRDPWEISKFFIESFKSSQGQTADT